MHLQFSNSQVLFHIIAYINLRTTNKLHACITSGSADIINLWVGKLQFYQLLFRISQS